MQSYWESESLEGWGARRGVTEEGKTSRWTLKDSRDWVWGQTVPMGRRVDAVASKAGAPMHGPA